MSLELGGKSPDIVFAGADLEAAVPGAAMVDCSIKFCLFAAGFELLHAIGVDSITAVVAALMNVNLSKNDGSKK